MCPFWRPLTTHIQLIKEKVAEDIICPTVNSEGLEYIRMEPRRVWGNNQDILTWKGNFLDVQFKVKHLPFAIYDNKLIFWIIFSIWKHYLMTTQHLSVSTFEVTIPDIAMNSVYYNVY